MVRFLALALASSLIAFPARADLQLSPKPVEHMLDGAKLTELAFSDGGSKSVTYKPPHGWECTGTSNQLTLRPPKAHQAQAIISKAPLPDPAEFNEKITQKLVDEAVAGVPKGSLNVTVVSREKNPLMIDGKETFLVVMSYNFYNEIYRRSILFLNRPGEQIRFQLTCHQADFDQLQKAFLRSHYTWQNL